MKVSSCFACLEPFSLEKKQQKQQINKQKNEKTWRKHLSSALFK
jgi:hypothetical protein